MMGCWKYQRKAIQLENIDGINCQTVVVNITKGTGLSNEKQLLYSYLLQREMTAILRAIERSYIELAPSQPFTDVPRHCFHECQLGSRSNSLKLTHET
ncbi:hypothetical protein SAMN05443580_12645 [Variovorax sp. OV084]|nr:hypothetical protein SAMN05443580_12645 [Variovorax sp. OV084]